VLPLFGRQIFAFYDLSVENLLTNYLSKNSIFGRLAKKNSIKNYILGKIAHFWIRPFRFSSFLFFSFFNFCLLLLIFYFHVLCLILLQNYSFRVLLKNLQIVSQMIWTIYNRVIFVFLSVCLFACLFVCLFIFLFLFLVFYLAVTRAQRL